MSGLVYLITGGTGSFGRAAVKALLARDDVRKVRVMSRDEAKHASLKAEFSEAVESGRLITMLGDVADADRVQRACAGADYVLHAAALKRIEAVQFDPAEAVRVNVIGSLNVAQAVESQRCKAGLLISSDKGCAPINLYGVTKLLGEHLFSSVGSEFGEPGRGSRLVSVRYGNVWGSRGSVVEMWRDAAAAGQAIELSNPEATRFFWPIEQAVELALWALENLQNGETVVPMMRAARMGDLAEAVGVEVKRVDMRDAEKRHEALLTGFEVERSNKLSPVDTGLPFEVLVVPPITGERCERTDKDPGIKAITSDSVPRLNVAELVQALAGDDYLWQRTQDELVSV